MVPDRVQNAIIFISLSPVATEYGPIGPRCFAADCSPPTRPVWKKYASGKRKEQQEKTKTIYQIWPWLAEERRRRDSHVFNCWEWGSHKGFPWDTSRIANSKMIDSLDEKILLINTMPRNTIQGHKIFCSAFNLGYTMCWKTTEGVRDLDIKSESLGW